jgi:hypothetical protein
MGMLGRHIDNDLTKEELENILNGRLKSVEFFFSDATDKKGCLHQVASLDLRYGRFNYFYLLIRTQYDRLWLRFNGIYTSKFGSVSTLLIDATPESMDRLNLIIKNRVRKRLMVLAAETGTTIEPSIKESAANANV